MKQQLSDLFAQAIEQLKAEAVIPEEQHVALMFERTRQKEHGDFATNVAMTLAKAVRRNPRELAELIVAALPQDSLIARADIAGPGFINVFLAEDARYAVLSRIFAEGDGYGLATAHSKRKVLIEFVSANPTGPLHVGHGRGAAYGDALARVLTATGNQVEREYYVNDAGRQMDILAVSVWIRYLQINDVEIGLPENAYRGDYIITMAKEIKAEYGAKYLVTATDITAARAELDAEAALDATIALAQAKLGEAGFAVFFDRILDSTLAGIRKDLSAFGVNYDTWFSERSLFDNGKIEAIIQRLKASDYLYKKGGAWWFRSTDFGDAKDRVVVRENGQPTYFASDIAYHKDKIDRGFDECINIWGADHHGYISRVKAAMQALGLDQDKLTILLVQFAVLYRDGEKVKMTTRGGKYVELKTLCEDIGTDAARFFYVQRKSEQHMDFDLDLAKSQSNDNPVYYVQYAHARICSIFRQARERGIKLNLPQQSDFSLLSSDHEQSLLILLQRFPEVVQSAADNYEPHQLNYYLRDTATAFHAYYNSIKFLDAEPATREAMLALCQATRQVLANGLSIIGVAALESM